MALIAVRLDCYRKKQRGDCNSFEFIRAAAERAQYIHNRHHPDYQPSTSYSRLGTSFRDVSRHPSLTLRQLERQYLSHQVNHIFLPIDEHVSFRSTKKSIGPLIRWPSTRASQLLWISRIFVVILRWTKTRSRRVYRRPPSFAQKRRLRRDWISPARMKKSNRWHHPQAARTVASNSVCTRVASIWVISPHLDSNGNQRQFPHFRTTILFPRTNSVFPI